MQLEVGKRYVRRDGSISGVLEDYDGQDDYPFADEYESYTAEGKYLAGSTRDHEFDLVSEYVEPGQAAVPTIPGLEEYKVLRYGHAETGEWVVHEGVCSQWTGMQTSGYKYIIVAPPTPPAPAKRTVVFREVAERYGSQWFLNWTSDGKPTDGCIEPDEIIPTGNERTVEL